MVAFSEMVDHMSLPGGILWPFVGLSPGMVVLSNTTRVSSAISEEFLVRHFLGIQLTFESKKSDNVFSFPGTDNPADGLSEAKGRYVPSPSPVGIGNLLPRILAPISRRCFFGERRGAIGFSLSPSLLSVLCVL